MARARLDKNPREISVMFDRVADRYDVLNDVLSMGQDRRWRRAVAASIGARAGERVLDLAAGTGTVSRILAEDGADCVACDFSLGMLQAEQAGTGGQPVSRTRAAGERSGSSPGTRWRCRCATARSMP